MRIARPEMILAWLLDMVSGNVERAPKGGHPDDEPFRTPGVPCVCVCVPCSVLFNVCRDDELPSHVLRGAERHAFETCDTCVPFAQHHLTLL